MQKRFYNIFSSLMLAAGASVVLAGGWCLAHSIAQAKRVPTPVICIPIGQLQVSPPTTDEEEPPAQEDKPVTYDPNIPLSPELQGALQEACDAYQVPECLALGLMEVESRFQVEADNGQCYGLTQLNRDYFPSNLSPAENIWAGVEYLGRLLKQYRDTAAALCAYNAGHDTGYRGYANAVLAAAERWEHTVNAWGGE